jgi:hypothetical protein
VNTDLEVLLRSGMDRFTDDVPVPRGLARRAAQVHRRRMATRAAAGAGTAVVAAAAVFAATGGSGAGGGAIHAKSAAYVLSRVDNAVASKHLVVRATTASNTWGPTTAWAYGQRSRMEEFTGTNCGHVKPNGDCTNQGGSERYLADGTALIHGKLTGVYLTYFDRRWSLSPQDHSPSACSTTGSFAVDGPGIPTSNWPSFIHATIACGAATVTGHVKINGVETLRITGKAVTAKLTASEARDLRQKWVTAQWTLYVNPKTYLPVRMSSLTKWFGGPAHSTHSAVVTNMQWLPATKANIAKALVTIPPGYHQVKSVANQQPA